MIRKANWAVAATATLVLLGAAPWAGASVGEDSQFTASSFRAQGITTALLAVGGQEVGDLHALLPDSIDYDLRPREPKAEAWLRTDPLLPALKLRPRWRHAESHWARLERVFQPPLIDSMPEFRVAEIALGVPSHHRKRVDAYIEYFTHRGRWFFRRWLARSGRYIPLMRPILRQHGIPDDLVYLAMIESGFKAKAESTASATGYWQFIRSTGEIYGLKQTAWTDDRRDFIRSTEAAAQYLSYLHRTFNDWYLAMAAYNAGPGRIRRALQRYGEDDYWGLISHPASLAEETQNYVPKLLAAATIAKNPKHYGFDPRQREAPLRFDTITVARATDLRIIARQLAVPLKTLRELNPALLYDVTPSGQHFKLRVPRGRGAELRAALASLPKDRRLNYAQHRVARGDTVYGLARRFGTTVAAICDANGIRNPRSLTTGQRLIIPSRHNTSGLSARLRRPRTTTPPPPGHTQPAGGGSASIARSQPSNRTALRPPPAPSARHVVSAGDTLWSIARRYGVTVSQIKAWNGRLSNLISVGDVLRIY